MKQKEISPVRLLLRWAGPEKKWLIGSVLCAFGSGLLAITACAFLISDTVEHHRLLAPIFLHNAQYGDMIEELYELPFMAGLFLMNLGFMQRDMQEESVSIRFSEPHLVK